LFVGLVALAVAVALVEDERPFLEALRSPVVVCLLALAALAAISSLWTVAAPGAAARWGLVIGAYGAVAALAASAGRRGLVALALILVGLAAIEAAIGLAAAGLRVGPYAERIGGVWRPGGTFEYPPALALLQVMALPALLRWMVGARPGRAAAAAAGAALAGGVIALAASRVELALGVLVVASACVASRSTVNASRPGAFLAAAVPILAGMGARLAAGGYAFPGATGGDVWRLIALGSIPLGTAFVWWLLRRRGLPTTSPAGTAPAWPRRIAMGLALVVLVAAIGSLDASARDGGRPWVEPTSGFSHGRTAEWEAAFDTATDRPFLGAGSEAYLRASEPHQGANVSLYAHDLPLEMWSELGIIGLALVVALYALAGRLLWRLRNELDAWLVAPAVAAFLVANLVDWPWHLAGIGALWALALGGCIALETDAPPKRAAA
jgi:O-antigen ligase